MPRSTAGETPAATTRRFHFLDCDRPLALSQTLGARYVLTRLKLALSDSSLALMRDTKTAARRFDCSILTACALFAGCSSPKPNAELATKDPEPFVRVQNTDSNFVQLQIAVREFVPVRGYGPVIWLTGVSHIGES